MINSKTTFMGYRRENGRVGVRNHVIILPLDDLSNAACEAVVHNIKGTTMVGHPYGRLQFGADLDLHFRTLIGTGTNPNVAGVIVIGIEPGWTGRIVEGIAKSGTLGVTDQVMKGMIKMQEERTAAAQAANAALAPAAAAPMSAIEQNPAMHALAAQDAAIALVAGARTPIRR